MALQFSYQWFGDLVSMNSPYNEYLTKGFALFLSELMFDEYHVNINLQVSFKRQMRKTFCLLQLLPRSHSYSLITTLQPVLQEESLQLYSENEFTHKKAAMLLRMLFNVISENTFKNSVNSFLKKLLVII